MRRQSYFAGSFFTIGDFDFDERAVNADTVSLAFGYSVVFVAVNIKQLVLQRRRARI